MTCDYFNLFHCYFIVSSSPLVLCRDLGVHVDGFIANVAHSFVVGASKVRVFLQILLKSKFCVLSHRHICKSSSHCVLFLQENPVTGRKADVIKAAHLCAEAALRLVKPGNQVCLTPFSVFFMSVIITSLRINWTSSSSLCFSSLCSATSM